MVRAVSASKSGARFRTAGSFVDIIVAAQEEDEEVCSQRGPTVPLAS